MTEEQAEEIYLANEVGMFNGQRSELVQAILILSAREREYQESTTDNPHIAQPPIEDIASL